MATQQKAAAPKKNSEGFQGVRGAFWIIVVCAAIAFTLFFTWFGAGMHFEGGVTSGAPLDVWGTIFKGGIVCLSSSLCCSRCSLWVSSVSSL